MLRRYQQADRRFHGNGQARLSQLIARDVHADKRHPFSVMILLVSLSERTGGLDLGGRTLPGHRLVLRTAGRCSLAASPQASTVAVVGDGAVGLLAVLAARHLGAERIITMSRHEHRQKLALGFGATDIVTERGDEGVARIKDLTNGLGAHCVIEAVGTQESMMQAIGATRPGGHVG